MKRRLNRAYDNMTMPDGCTHRIEQKLNDQLLQQKTGQYVKSISPTPVRRNGWAAAVAAVCLMLVLSVGGTMLFLNVSETMLDRPQETVVTFVAEQTAVATPEDHYELVTRLSVEEVESFAKVVRHNVMTENWKALSGKIQYPITIGDQEIKDKAEFVALMEETTLGSHFLLGMEYESCTAMFCNWQGICMGDGLIWINEAPGSRLKVTAINGLTEETEDMADFTVRIVKDDTRAIHQYTGCEKEVDFPNIIGGALITEIGTGQPVIVNGDTVKTVHLQEIVTAVGDYAFANCPALEGVYFQGDAPAEAEGVFDGSENVIVYYKSGTKGWGDTWCGRKTQSCIVTNISLGTATVQRKVPQELASVLDDGKAWFSDTGKEMTIQDYCEAVSGDMETDAEAVAFTVADMDGDGICEVMLRLCGDGEGDLGYVVLHCGNGFVSGHFFRYGEMRDIKKDGSFYRSRNASEEGEFKLEFDHHDVYFSRVSEMQTDRPPASWHTYPCERADLVLQSYEYVSGTGWSLLPGNAYYHFEGLVLGSMGNDWNLQKEQMLRYGIICVEDEGTVCVFDPDAPGTALYGVLTNENGVVQFSELGYYICTEEKEYVAEVRNMLSEAPEYWVDAHLPFLGSMGRRVYTTAKLLDYLNGKELNDVQESEISLEHERIRMLMNDFVKSFSANDAEGMKACLADGASGSEIDVIDVNLEIISYSNLPSQVVEAGGAWNIDLMLREVDNPAAAWYLTAMLVKQEDGWRISSCHLF